MGHSDQKVPISVSVVANKILMTEPRYGRKAPGGETCSSNTSHVVVKGSVRLGCMDLLPDKYFLCAIREIH